MNDYAMLMQTIRMQPSEDTPRLMLADWWDEFGNENQRARAEFVRLQVLRESLPAGSGKASAPAALRELASRCNVAREFALMRAYGRQWLGLPEEGGTWCPGHLFTYEMASGYVQGVFRRGFVFVVMCPPSWWARHGRSLYDENPIQDVTFYCDDDEKSPVDDFADSYPEISFFVQRG